MSGAVVEARALRLAEPAPTIEAVAPTLESRSMSPGEGEVLVEVRAAAVNPSDAKAAIGMMPQAVWPRTPGRDFAGVVTAGRADLVGQAVFGSSGHLGIRRDGTHGTRLVVEADALVAKPDALSFKEAAGLGVPFVTANEGFRRSGPPKPGEVVLILGLNGKVGQAAAQIASWRGARVIGVVRRDEGYVGHASGPVDVIDSSRGDAPERVRALTDGKGADIVFNTVGDPYYEIGVRSLATLGRKIFITAVNKIVSFDTFAFYRNRHTYVGADSLSLSSVASADVLRELLPGFASGHLKPYPIARHAIYPLEPEAARAAYVAVLSAARDRLVFRP